MEPQGPVPLCQRSCLLGVCISVCVWREQRRTEWKCEGREKKKNNRTKIRVVMFEEESAYQEKNSVTYNRGFAVFSPLDKTILTFTFTVPSTAMILSSLVYLIKAATCCWNQPVITDYKHTTFQHHQPGNSICKTRGICPV